MWELISLFTVVRIALAVTPDSSAPPELVKNLHQAVECLEDGKPEEAATLLESVLAREPLLADGHRLLGYARVSLGQNGKARESFARSIELGGLLPEVLEQMAAIDQEAGSILSLRAGLQLRLLLEPANLEWSLYYADILLLDGLDAEAEAVLKGLQRVHPARPEIPARLGNLHLRQDRRREAVAAFETAAALGERGADLRKTIAELWFALGDTERALSWYEPLAGENPLRWAEILFASGDDARSETEIRKVLEARSDPRALALLGRIALKRGDPETAVQTWEEAIRLGLDDPQIPVFIAGHYFNRQEYGQAIPYLERCIDSNPADRDLPIRLITCRIRTDQADRAREAIRGYIERFGLDEMAESAIEALLRDRPAGDGT